jgi:hypothetical protein
MGDQTWDYIKARPVLRVVKASTSLTTIRRPARSA